MHHEFTWLEWLFEGVTPKNIHVYSALIVAFFLIGAALLYKRSLKSAEAELVPSPRLSLKNLFQVTVENVLSLMEGIIGPDARRYFPLMGGLFIYIFVNNMLGSIPGFSSATTNVNTNLACALTVFVYYNYLGIRKQGEVNYFKHFMGPVWWIAPLLLAIELISHIVRPVTLSIRLFANLTGDHIVLGIFSDLVPLILPIVFMAFGIFISFIQAFVFVLLSSVYIGLAVAHEEH